MITHTQYALLVGIPTSTIILACIIQTWAYRRFLRIMNRNFDRFEQTMVAAEAKHTKT